jgi:hypothetical protein
VRHAPAALGRARQCISGARLLIRRWVIPNQVAVGRSAPCAGHPGARMTAGFRRAPD